MLWKKPYKSRKRAMKKVLEIVSEHADLEQPRHIRHFSYFSTRECQDSFCEEVRKLGYLVENTHSNAIGDKKYSVRFGRVEVVDDSVIESGYRDLGALSERFGGEYDGFEVAIDTSQKAVQ